VSRDGAQQFYDVCYVVCVCACAEVGEGEEGREKDREGGRQAGREGREGEEGWEEGEREGGRQAGREGREGGRQGGRGGRGRKGGKADIIYIKLAAKRKQSYYWTNLHPWSSHVQSVAQRGSHQLPVQRSEEEKEVITNRTTQEAVVGMGAQQVACFNNIQTYTCTPPY